MIDRIGPMFSAISVALLIYTLPLSSLHLTLDLHDSLKATRLSMHKMRPARILSSERKGHHSRPRLSLAGTSLHGPSDVPEVQLS